MSKKKKELLISKGNQRRRELVNLQVKNQKKETTLNRKKAIAEKRAKKQKEDVQE